MPRLILIAVAMLLAAGCAGTPDSSGEADVKEKEQAKGVTLPPFETVVLDNGMQVLMMEKHDVPMVSFTALVRGGAVAEPEEKSGTASLLAELLSKGAGRRDAAGFAGAVESVGGRLDTSAGKESLSVSGNFMVRDTDIMLELLGDVLMDPALQRNEFDKLRERKIQQISSMKDTNLRGLVSVYGEAYLFGEHPYGKVSFGTEAGLAEVTYADIRRYFIEHVGADRTILAVVGDFDAATMRERIEDRFQGWRKAQGELPVVEPKQPERPQVLLVDKPDATQTYFYLGNVGVARDYPDRAALDLVNTVFGGRFTSMLNTRLRVESGLTYGAGSRTAQYTQPGSVAVISFTQTETTGEAIDMAIATLEQLHADGLSAEQLESARSYVLGQFPPELETNGAVASRLASLAFYGLDRDDVDEYAERISAVTIEDARRVIEDVYPASNELVLVMIGNAAEIRERAAGYGPVTEMKITDPVFRPR